MIARNVHSMYTQQWFDPWLAGYQTVLRLTLQWFVQLKTLFSYWFVCLVQLDDRRMPINQAGLAAVPANSDYPGTSYPPVA